MKLNLIINAPQYQLAIEASSLTEFTEVKQYLVDNKIISADGGAAKAAPADVKKEATPTPTPTPAATPSPAASKPGKPGKGATAAATAKADAGSTIEDVTAVLTKVADKFGLPEALKLNGRFGVKKAGELKAEQYADYIKFAQHCIDDEVEPSGAHPDFDAGGSDGEDVSSLV